MSQFKYYLLQHKGTRSLRTVALCTECLATIHYSEPVSGVQSAIDAHQCYEKVIKED